MPVQHAARRAAEPDHVCGAAVGGNKSRNRVPEPGVQDLVGRQVPFGTGDSDLPLLVGRRTAGPYVRRSLNPTEPVKICFVDWELFDISDISML